MCEGGPILNGLLLAEGLIDELCVTMSPLLVGGAAARIVHGTLTPPSPVSHAIGLVLEADDGVLFLRYVRTDVVRADLGRPAPAAPGGTLPPSTRDRGARY